MGNLHLNNKKDYKNPSYKRPDHPSFHEKKHSMLIDAQGASNRTIQTESGALRLENGVAVLPDDSRARDIYDEIQQTEALHPEQYSLVEKKMTVNTDPVHRYTFGSHPAMPWATYDEHGRRVEDTENSQEEQNDRPNKQGKRDGSPQRSAS